MYRTLFSICIAAASCAAFSQLVSVGEFSGSLNEGFESFENHRVVSSRVSLDVMGGAATFVSMPSVGASQIYVYEPSAGATWGLNANGFAVVRSGTKGGAFFSGAGIGVSLDFDNAVSRFGGYFATASNETTTVRLFDTLGNQIGADQSILTGSNAMTWFGWESSVAIGSVEFLGGTAPVMDDLQADAVPEPATMVLASGVGLAWLRRRKKSA